MQTPLSPSRQRWEQVKKLPLKIATPSPTPEERQLAEDEERVLNTPRAGEQCKHFGAFKRLIDCGCAIRSKVFICAAPENPVHECTIHKQGYEPQVAGCKGCNWRKIPDELLPRPNPPVPYWESIPAICSETRIAPRWFHLIDGQRLKPGADNFNGSLMRWRGKLFLAYRHRFGRAEIRFAELDHNLAPIHDMTINPRQITGRNKVACEDPRLFLRGDQLWMSYNGIGYDAGGKKMVTQSVSQIDEAGRLTASKWARYPRSRVTFGDYEKNWAFFDYDVGLNCVYQPAPAHVVLRSNDNANWVDCGETPFAGIPQLGLLRGGAMPFWRKGEWYSFCHTIFNSPNPAKGGTNRFYTTALYTFADTPPFAPCRMLPFPLLTPTLTGYQSHSGRIVFVCGAFYENGQWIISGGWQDKQVFVAAYDADEIERNLVRI
jgi:hypothetical protein